MTLKSTQKNLEKIWNNEKPGLCKSSNKSEWKIKIVYKIEKKIKNLKFVTRNIETQNAWKQKIYGQWQSTKMICSL